ncbi:MAG: hypothetical protein MZW92_81775 [Comamonadaceae bacterium]|nr:hypothetical protein [Comamonadaceae bacterium]
MIEDIEGDLYHAIDRAADRAGRTAARRVARSREPPRAAASSGNLIPAGSGSSCCVDLTGGTQMNQHHQTLPLQTAATADHSAAGVLASNRVLRNTYLLLSMTLLFSAAAAGLSVAAMNCPTRA